MLTQGRLKELLHYNPDTGVFTHKSNPDPRAVVGGVVGTINGHGYLILTVDGKTRNAHRLIFLYMDGSFPDKDIDHINGIKTDNRWANLRTVTQSENSKNAKLSKANKSGLPGVYWYEARKRWRVVCSTRFIGRYEDFFEAVCARKSAESRENYHINHGRAV